MVEKRSATEIGRIYGCNKTTIQNALKLADIAAREIGGVDRPNALYKVDADFFDVIDTEQKAYILGFLLADGHVSTNYKIMFGIHERDRDVLEKIKAAMNSDAPVRSKENKVFFEVGSRHMCEVLANYGFTNRKSERFELAMLLPVVPNTLRKNLVRGMFDGDGSILVYKYPYFKNHSYHLGYTG